MQSGLTLDLAELRTKTQKIDENFSLCSTVRSTRLFYRQWLAASSYLFLKFCAFFLSFSSA
jgi:hypothetical protein